MLPRFHALTAATLVALSGAAVAETPPATPQETAVRAHVAFLADDALKGREAGTPEYDRAAAYVAEQFRQAGLKPGGDAGGYQQRVPLVTYKAAGPGKATLTVAGKTAALAPEDFLAVANPLARTTGMTAPVVFVGYGIVAPDGADDYRGVDVRGKIVAFLPGVPASYTGDDRAFLSGEANKLAFAAARGAIGAVQVAAPGTTPRPPRGGGKGRMVWARADGTGSGPAAPMLAQLSETGAKKLFAGTPGRWAAIGKEVAANRAPAAVVLPASIAVESATDFVPATSSNVVGVLPGSDPALSREIVVLSAHLDHIGVSEKPDAKGDAINNGAMDDAIGIASLIEEAKRFRAAAPPKRTIVFLAVTAEEKGLVGSDYFAHHPPRALGTIVADVNLDMPILTYRFEDLVAFGGGHSTLGPIIEKAAKEIGVVMAPDPVPDMGIFVRSDHFRFVQQGVPSIFLWPGYKGEGKAAYEAFFRDRYHKPADDLSQPIRWDQAVRFVDVNYRIARGIADARERPMWNRGDYYGTLYGGPIVGSAGAN